jgi:Sec-independent protein translocase protein TatA
MGKIEGLLVLLVFALALFEAKKLTELAMGVGESMRELEKGISGDVRRAGITEVDVTNPKEG